MISIDYLKWKKSKQTYHMRMVEFALHFGIFIAALALLPYQDGDWLGKYRDIWIQSISTQDGEIAKKVIVRLEDQIGALDFKNQHFHSRNGFDIVLSLQDTETNKWTEVRIKN